tara:strand:- start:68 stop:307 length:240 start_codon:yes stop_codon:yes gene_type:complete
MYPISYDVKYESRGGRTSKYDFSFVDEIQVGGSVEMSAREVQALRSFLKRKRDGGELQHFTIRTSVQKESGNVRVWRHT